MLTRVKIADVFAHAGAFKSISETLAEHTVG